MNHLTHLDEDGNAKMVDVSEKPPQSRTAKAKGFIYLQSETLNQIDTNQLKKGDVLTVAKIAGIQAAKNTAQLIPLCHPIPLTKIDVSFSRKENGIEVYSEAKSLGVTGVEMEALTAVHVALLTIYDMCKAIDKSMEMSHITLVEKKKESL